MWGLDYYGINQKIADMQAVREQGLHNIAGTIQRRIKDYLQLNRTRVTVWQPEHWELQVSVVPLAIRLKNMSVISHMLLLMWVSLAILVVTVWCIWEHCCLCLIYVVLLIFCMPQYCR